MNIVSVIAGMTIMGVAAPQIANMSIQPFIAQKRALNFGIAESAAVTYAAQHEGASQLSATPSGCITDITNSPAIEITCTEGENQFVQTVSRSFRLDVQATNPATPSSGRTFDYPYPTLGFTKTYCHTWEDWGINTSAFDRATNTWVGESCTPFETTAESRYALSDVEAWRYDIHKINGFGPHSDY